MTAVVTDPASPAQVPVLVAGIPELGALLAAHPDLAVTAPARGVALRELLDQLAQTSVPFAGVVVATTGSDPDIGRTALTLWQEGVAIVVLDGVDGQRSGTEVRVPTLTVPFSPDDVVDLIRQLSGAGARLRAVGDTVRADAAPATAVTWGPPAPAPPRPPAHTPPQAPRPRPPWEEDAPGGFAPPAPEAWDAALGTRSGSEPRGGRRRPGVPQVIAFACPKGGSGKTSLSINYAAFLADRLRERDRRVVWVDGNVQQSDGARYLGADERSSRSIVDLVGRPEIDDRSVLAAVTPPDRSGGPMWALFGPMVKRDADPAAVTPALYRESVRVLRRHFDHVVVDTPVAEHYDELFRAFILPEADVLTVVVPPLLPVVRGVREWLEMQIQPVAAGGSAFPAERVMVVLNMDRADSGCPVEVVRDSWLTRWSWGGSIPYEPAWTPATNDGRLMAKAPSLVGPFAELVRRTTGEVVDGGGRSRRRRHLAGELLARLRH